MRVLLNEQEEFWQTPIQLKAPNKAPNQSDIVHGCCRYDTQEAFAPKCKTTKLHLNEFSPQAASRNSQSILMAGNERHFPHSPSSERKGELAVEVSLRSFGTQPRGLIAKFAVDIPRGQALCVCVQSVMLPLVFTIIRICILLLGRRVCCCAHRQTNKQADQVHRGAASRCLSERVRKADVCSPYVFKYRPFLRHTLANWGCSHRGKVLLLPPKSVLQVRMSLFVLECEQTRPTRFEELACVCEYVCWRKGRRCHHFSYFIVLGSLLRISFSTRKAVMHYLVLN